MIYAITGPIAAGKSTFTKELSKQLKIDYFDLDIFCKTAFKNEPIQNWLKFVLGEDYQTDLINKIWNKIIPNDALYKKYCSFFEQQISTCIKRKIEQNEDVIFEASALYSYPRLLELFDVIIEIDQSYLERQKRCDARYNNKNIFINSDLIYFKNKSNSLTDHILNNNYFYINQNQNVELMVSNFIKNYNELKTHYPIGLFCGSFNPWTIGHQDILNKAKLVFDEVHVVQAINPEKINPILPIQNCISTDYIPNVIRQFQNRQVVLIRGIRNSKDAEESTQWHRNIELCLGYEIPLILIHCSKEMEQISSTFVRNVQKLNQEDAKKFLG